MKLDLLYEIDSPRPWDAGPHPYGQRVREQRAYAEMLDQVKLADTLGFHIAWFVEHHFREGRSHCPAPEVVIGALTQATENIRLGFGVTLLPYGFTHPTRVAEKVATADILSHGRIEWGTGRSTPMEQTAFHVDREASRAEWAEAIEIICAMWRDEYFEWDSPTFQFPRRLITPKPYQDPHPPAWMAATSEGSSAVAGSNQLGLLSFSIMQPLEKMAAQIRAYREAWNSPDAKPISDVATNKVAAYTLVHCAETEQQARDNGVWDSVAWWYQNIAQFTLEWELPHLDPAAQEASFPLLKPLMEGNIPIESFDEGDMIVVGDPERCFEKMKHYADLGVDELICYVQFGYHSGESTLKTIELLGKEVLPELEKYTPLDVGANLAQFID
ncbi:MAG TPA: LLM class flavin-dependent oxidoreductase [Acidimicrobiia bacterium]|jgi:alkanesulfonate monooxygenase SsuD/methylene tetrahydromethanopterin reductase-like flavin-dependent oxidoreductase (luciferase family)